MSSHDSQYDFPGLWSRAAVDSQPNPGDGDTGAAAVARGVLRQLADRPTGQNRQLADRDREAREARESREARERRVPSGGEGGRIDNSWLDEPLDKTGAAAGLREGT
jgi:hypothetical protein